jgi:sugar/nucleoside kinase (ribokinase family)
MLRAIEVAREAGRKVAFTLSDTFCVDRHRDGFNALLDGGRIDILFSNQAEIEALAGEPHLETALAMAKDKVETLVVTRSEHGALAIRGGGERVDVPAEPIDALVDTTGAGDLFASGFLLGYARDLGLERSLKLGAICAAEVIQHFGARPEKDLKALAGNILA